MPPEDNPQDDVQPTKEEWEAFERASAEDGTAKKNPVDVQLAILNHYVYTHQNTLPDSEIWKALEYIEGSARLGGSVQDHLDSHIRSWRENFKLEDERLRNRGIDAVDALQQFRLQVFGALLPHDDGSFAVFKDHGASGLITVESHEAARAVHGEP